MKYLIIRFSAMGDVAMTSPVVASVAKENPRDEFVVLTQGWLTPLFDKGDNIKTIGIKFDDYKGVIGIFRLFMTLRKEHFDIILDLHDVLRSKLLVLFFQISGVPCHIIDKGRKEKRNLVCGKLRKQLKSSIERYCDVFRDSNLSVDLPPRGTKSILPLPEAFREEKKGHWYGIAPFAQHRGKAYPIDKSRELIRLLSQRAEDRVFIFSGGGEEKAIVDEIVTSTKNAVGVFGKVRLDGEKALMSHLDALVSMDSGAMHIASIVGCRCISVWGATHPWAGFLGYGQCDDDIISLPMECRPCSIYGNKPCKNGDYACLNIDPKIIYKRVVEAG
ncbi:MAG: glycosyltransferase family 9 protein [Rikenellaceae bacterium]